MSAKDIITLIVIIFIVLCSLGIYLFLKHKITNKSLAIFIGILTLVCISLALALSKPKQNCPQCPSTERQSSCPPCPPTPSPPTPPSGDCVKTNDTPFPNTQGKPFCLQYRNSTKVPIMVWHMGNQPPCLEGNKKCKYSQNSIWTKDVNAKFYVNDKSIPASRYVTLKPGDILRVEPATNSKGEPEWCWYDKKGVSTCAGTRSWFTPVVKNPGGVKANEFFTGFEFNFSNNGGGPDYDISAVDGINANITVEYTGECKGLERKKSLLVNMDSCPKQFQRDGSMDGPKSCVSPKYDYTLSLGDLNMAGCPYGSNTKGCTQGKATGQDCTCGDSCDKKLDCHKWWVNSDKPGVAWANYVQKTCKGGSDSYAWAYDEKLYKDGDTAYSCNCDPGPPNQTGGIPVTGCAQSGECKPTGNTRDNPLNPNVNCGPPNPPAKPGEQLNIDILDIMGLGKIIVPVQCDPTVTPKEKCPGGGDCPPNGHCHPTPTPTPPTPTPGGGCPGCTTEQCGMKQAQCGSAAPYFQTVSPYSCSSTPLDKDCCKITACGTVRCTQGSKCPDLSDCPSNGWCK